MASLATATQLAGFLQQDVDTYSADQALAGASGAIRDYCGWSITQETVTGAVLDGTGRRSVWLPTLRLTSVASVTEDGLAVAATTGFTFTTYGALRRVDGRWSHLPGSVVVTYTHGYVTAPDSVVLVCLALAARGFGNPHGFSRAALDDFSYVLPSGPESGSPLIGEAERRALAAYQLPAVA